jgi:ferritin-like protein
MKVVQILNYDNDTDKYLGLIINGMDKRKDIFATFSLYAKEFRRGKYYTISLSHCMGFNGQISPRIYFIAPNIHDDVNLTITIIYHMVTHWPRNLPQVSYL